MRSLPAPNDYPAHENGEVWIPLSGKFYTRIMYGKEGLDSEGITEKRIKYLSKRFVVGMILWVILWLLPFILGLEIVQSTDSIASTNTRVVAIAISAVSLFIWFTLPLMIVKRGKTGFFVVRKDSLIAYNPYDQPFLSASRSNRYRFDEIAGIFIFGVTNNGVRTQGGPRMKEMPTPALEILMRDGTNNIMPSYGDQFEPGLAEKLFDVLQMKTRELGIPFNETSNLYYLEKSKHYNDLTAEETKNARDLLEKELEYENYARAIVEQAMEWYEREGNYHTMREIGDRFLKNHMGPLSLGGDERIFFQRYLLALMVLKDFEKAEAIYLKYEDEVPKYLDMVFFYIISLVGQGREEEGKIITEHYQERFIDENYDLLLGEIAEDVKPIVSDPPEGEPSTGMEL
jgi:hypothetical protein